jgi:hypothetical protein
MKANTPSSSPIIPTLADALAVAAIAVHKSNPSIHGRLMVKRPLLFVAAKEAIPATRPSAPATLTSASYGQLLMPLVPLLSDL